MGNLDTLIQDLVIANRILAREEVVDAYGHVSVRHPDNPNCFLIARSLAPELVGLEDIVELDLDGQPVRPEDRSLYLERFIHAAIFAARPDVMAVVHAHAEDTLPFGIAQGTKLRPVIHSGSFIGTEVPVWDIADNFGETNLLVTNMAQASDLAKCLIAAAITAPTPLMPPSPTLLMPSGLSGLGASSVTSTSTAGVSRAVERGGHAAPPRVIAP